jgi:hypothetical protein
VASLATPNIDRGDSNYDICHAPTAGVAYDLPAPRSDQASRAILGGWSLDAFLARAAPPVDVIGAEFIANGTALTPRPNVNPGLPLEVFGSAYPGGKIFRGAAFTAAPAGQQGDFCCNLL